MNYEDKVSRDGLPGNIAAERVVLGNLISYLPEQRGILEASLGTLDYSFFSLDSHQKILAAIVRVCDKGGLPDFVTVADELIKKRELEPVGGRPYLISLTEDLPRGMDISNYIGILREAAQRRQLLRTVDLYANQAVDTSCDPEESISSAIASLQTVLESGQKAVIEPIGWFLDEEDKRTNDDPFTTLSNTNGIEFGWPALDNLIGGLQGGDLMVVAARPSMGKTAWMCNAAWNTAVRKGKIVAAYTLEQKKEQIIRRMLAAATRIESEAIKAGRLDNRDKELLREYRNQLRESHLYLADTPGLTVTDIRTQARRLKNTVGLDLILIDQLSKVSRRDVREKGMPKHEQVGEQTSGLKRLAQDLNVPVVVLNQLGRASTKNKDNRPTLTDLKESGSIEEDADVVTFIHRPEYYDRGNEDLAGKAEFIVEKNREGHTGTAKVEYNAHIQRFIDASEVQPKQTNLLRADEYPW